MSEGDYELVSRYKWFAHYSKNTDSFYAGTNSKETGFVRLHTFLMRPQKGFVVDHINHNTLDNRRSNLRIVTVKQNQQNKIGAYKNSKTGVRGVTKLKGKFTPRIKVEDKQLYLGQFSSVEEAEMVYIMANMFYFGEYGGYV